MPHYEKQIEKTIEKNISGVCKMLNDDLEYPEELYDFLKVLEYGANKHGANNWLTPDGNKSSEKNMFASALRHIGSSLDGPSLDHESGLDHILHAITRLNMIYTRRKRGLRHGND